MERSICPTTETGLAGETWPSGETVGRVVSTTCVGVPATSPPLTLTCSARLRTSSIVSNVSNKRQTSSTSSVEVFNFNDVLDHDMMDDDG